MAGRFAVGAMITAAGHLFLAIALEGGIKLAALVAGTLLVWFGWAAVGVIRLARARAYGKNADVWRREQLGFAAGVVCGTPLMVMLLGFVTAERVPDLTRIAKDTFDVALRNYRDDVGDYPSPEHGLKALFENQGTPSWRGPYAPASLAQYVEWFHYILGPDGTPALVARNRRVATRNTAP